MLLRQIGGTSAELQAYDLAGQLVQTVTVPDSYSCDLAVEPDTGKLWVATNAGAQRYSSTGILELDILFPPRPLQVILGCPRSVAPDGEGGAWVAARAGAVALVG